LEWTLPVEAKVRVGLVSTFRYVLVDVFTDTPLAGNSLAVFTDARDIPEDQLQPLAREMNLSETVFVYPAGWDPVTRRAFPGETASQSTGDRQNDGETVFVSPPEVGGHAKIRIFTPTSEIPFAGHPTLGTAFVLAGPLQLAEIRLEAGVGVIPVRLERDHARIVFGWMTQPVPKIEPYASADALLAALGVEESKLPVEVYDNGLQHVYVTLGSEDEVTALQPDLNALMRLPDVLGVNCFAGSKTHWKTRMFAPAGGVPEDPATGSAAGPLACHVVRHGLVEPGTTIEITQGVEIRRPSTLHARADGSPERIDKVEVGGAAVVVARGEFRFD
jgi:trans-2,3-dihydro-3-hydroxyanthranilate isomerase